MKTLNDNRPNILLIMTDEHRGDALGIEGHPIVETPYLDALATSGTHFTAGYSATPVCIPARRTLMTGTKASTHGVFMNYATHLDLPTLPGVLSAAGYQTHLVGKLHLYPDRKKYGFDSTDWADNPAQHDTSVIDDDYQMFLQEQGLYGPDIARAHGVDENGWVARPFHLDERFHFTNWCAEKAMRFLERRDPTAPFFLKMSIHAPHAPCAPPRYYFDKYMAMDIPEPAVAEWARVFDGPQRGLSVKSWRTALDPKVMKQYMAGYYGSIEHVDHQIGRVFNHVPTNTIIIFTSDHGEMLGDHQWIRKRSAFEGSARIPYIFKLPDSMGIDQAKPSDKVVELMDIMPTVLDAAGVDIPESVDGASLMPLLRDEDVVWRDYIHGECTPMETINSGMQFITDGKEKYIYYPGRGEEQFFDLVNDPVEMNNLIDDTDYSERVELNRARLINELDGRPENFVISGELQKLNGPTPSFLPEYERRPEQPEARNMESPVF